MKEKLLYLWVIVFVVGSFVLDLVAEHIFYFLEGFVAVVPNHAAALLPHLAGVLRSLF
jgi:hypothetical protein